MERSSNEEDQHNLFNNGDDTDADADYESDDDTSSDSSEGISNEPGSNAEPVSWKVNKKYPGKKKLRNTDKLARNRVKRARNEGKSYVDRKGNVHGHKAVKEYNHSCRYNCNNNINENKRNTIFQDYWNLGHWDLQTAFINSSVTLKNPKRRIERRNKNKNVSCIYTLAGHRVCKSFFIATLDISVKRVDNVVKSKQLSSSAISPKDKRGKKPPANKIPEQTINLIKEHIKFIPKYSSHYTREKAPNVKYLDPNLNLMKLYALYKEFCIERNELPVKDSYYRHVFNTSFNLSFHRPLTDTYNKCDSLQNKIDNGTPDESANAKIQKELHLRKAEAARSEKAKDKEEAKNDPSKVVICFDLQKTLPTLSLSCTNAYYCRQLWTYNFCIHNLVTGEAKMFMWHEGQASRGCEAIASCILKFVESLPATVKKVTVYSDNCSGQNKSHLIVKLWLYVVRNSTITTVNHKYLTVGHSYMECDQDFGLIEKAKKRNSRDIYVPNHCCDMVAKASWKFLVIRMNSSDFKSLGTLNPFLKQSVIGISKMQWMHFKKEDPFTLYYKETVCSDLEDFKTIDMRPQKKGRPTTADFPQLAQMAETHKLKESKFRDLLKLLPFVPPIHHSFFQELPHGGDCVATSSIQCDDADRVFDTDID